MVYSGNDNWSDTVLKFKLSSLTLLSEIWQSVWRNDNLISGMNVERTNLQFDPHCRADCEQIWTFLTSKVENSDIVDDQNQCNRDRTETCSENCTVVGQKQCHCKKPECATWRGYWVNTNETSTVSTAPSVSLKYLFHCFCFYFQRFLLIPF